MLSEKEGRMVMARSYFWWRTVVASAYFWWWGHVRRSAFCHFKPYGLGPDFWVVAAFVSLYYSYEAQCEGSIEDAFLFVDKQWRHEVVVYEKHDEVWHEYLPRKEDFFPTELNLGVACPPHHYAYDWCEQQEHPDAEIHQVFLFSVAFHRQRPPLLLFCCV